MRTVLPSLLTLSGQFPILQNQFRARNTDLDNLSEFWQEICKPKDKYAGGMETLNKPITFERWMHILCQLKSGSAAGLSGMIKKFPNEGKAVTKLITNGLSHPIIYQRAELLRFKGRRHQRTTVHPHKYHRRFPSSIVSNIMNIIPSNCFELIVVKIEDKRSSITTERWRLPDLYRP
ncbi:hypothetical protein C1646_312869 [Rhizophagus diaphanus]|nr:hypothetical protein C1646_312869 [Rhizophagus diaphanus] [Rhizophagus sp. MUCL 43196]